MLKVSLCDSIVTVIRCASSTYALDSGYVFNPSERRVSQNVYLKKFFDVL